jgi:ribosomal subunit interface protein
MNINIQSVNLKTGSKLETFIREKVSKLFTQSDNIIRADVILRKEKNRETVNKICEIRLMIPGYDHFVKKNSEKFYRSVLEAVQTLQKVLRRDKTKLISKRYANNYNELQLIGLANL